MASVAFRTRLACATFVGTYAVFILPCGSARAQSSDTATAEALFEEGRDLLRAGKAAEACPKLSESQRLDPATGTLLALAMCHKAEGKLASAWAEFVDAEARSRSESRSDREQVADTEAKGLRPRLSTLVINVPPELASLEGLEIRRDGVVLGRGAWNTAVPMDGGDHVVEANAAGKKPWRQSLTIKPESDAVSIIIPTLATAPIQNPSSSSAVSNPGADSSTSGRWSTLEWVGVGAAGAGVVALGVGGYFLSSALGKKSDSSHDCSGDVCGAQGFSDRNSAVSKGNTATVFGIAGGALFAGGAALFIIGRTRGQSSDHARDGLSIGPGPAGLGAHFSARF